MSATQIAGLLWNARRSGQYLAGMAPGLAPQDLAEAYEIQAETVRLAGGLAGWKANAANAGAAFRCAPLLRVTHAGTALTGVSAETRAEAELAFRLGAPLPRRERPYEVAEVWAAVATVHVAIELLGSRLAPALRSHPLLPLADCQANAGVIIGDGCAAALWQTVDHAQWRADLTLDGRSVAQAAPHATPRQMLETLTALADHAGIWNGGLARGDVVITGAWASPVAIGDARVIGAAITGLPPLHAELRA